MRTSNAVHTVVDSPVGPLTLVARDGALVGLYMDGQRRLPAAVRLGERVEHGFEDAATQLDEYFAGARTEFDLPIAPLGEPFPMRVWELLRTIPYGETRSYGELAGQLGDRTMAQAVGAASARNPIGLIIPCHRVVGADGSLVGYAGGLVRKRFLLDLEEPAERRRGRLF
ncbi:MAG: methylated-DNA--[protein]-cysteine S-methyltransferase [Actinomycetota bacterium]|nr:methylated-DNA--[protein]-cysteine S-methyltransferase [Actinomycetota bacterium]